MIGLYHVEINCNDIFCETYLLKDVECSSHCAITSYHNQQEEMADCWWPMLRKNKVFHDDLIDCNWVCTSTTDRTDGKYNFGELMGWQNSKSPLSASVTQRMHNPECCRDCKQRRSRGTAVIQRKYRSSEVNKSIAITTIDRNLRQNLCSVKSPNWFDRSPAMVSLIFTSDGSH